VPALVIGGEHDRVEPVDVLRDNLLPYLADAELIVLPDTGHLIPLEAAESLGDAIAGFVDARRHRAGGASGVSRALPRERRSLRPPHHVSPQLLKQPLVRTAGFGGVEHDAEIAAVDGEDVAVEGDRPEHGVHDRLP